MEIMLDNHDYLESQLVEIRLPLHLPYQTNWTSFERFDGEIEVNGTHYKYVKRKIEDGQLVLKCIRNDSKQRLQSAKEDFFRLVNDLQQEQPSKKNNPSHQQVAKNALGEFDHPSTLSLNVKTILLLTSYNRYCSSAYIAALLPTAEQPPEA